MEESVASYPRAPSEELQSLLLGGFLSPLLEVSERYVFGCKLDMHFRSDDSIHIYCGRARLLEVIRQKSEVSVVTIDANRVYTAQPCAKGLFGHWREDESGLTDALDRYLDEVKIGASYTEKEGLVQDRWSQIKSNPWTPFDREAALKYTGGGEERSKRAYFKEVDNARNILYNIAKHRPNKAKWAEPKEQSTERQIDQLGIDKDGNLVLVELKDGNSGNSASIFYAPLQLLGYVYEWHSAFCNARTRAQMNDLIRARQILGLMPESGLLTGGVRAAICFGDDVSSDEVKRRFYEALGVVNSHLPQGVQPVETWSLVKRLPKSL